MPTRRTVLTAGPAVVGAVSAQTQGASAQNAAPAAAAALPAFYRRRIGDVEVTAFHEGLVPRPLDGFIRNASLVEVQAALSRAFLPTDRLNNTFTTLVLRTGRNTAIVDTGFGDSGPPTTGGTWRNLTAAGIDPASVDTVLISHFHGDHITGVRLKEGALAFPNARILVPEPEWAFWMDDGRMAAAPEGLRPNFAAVRRVFGPEAARIERFAWGREVIPGVTALEAPGHTPGHTMFAVTSGGARLLVASDLTNHPALFVRNPDWSATFDMDADGARATRRRVLDMAATERLQLAFYHAPFPATGFVAKDGDGYAFVPAQWGV